MNVFWKARRKIVSLRLTTKFWSPTKAPGRPTTLSLTASQTPSTNGYAMNTVRIVKVGARSTAARMCSRSSSWLSRGGRRRVRAVATVMGTGSAAAPGRAASARIGSILCSAMAA